MRRTYFWQAFFWKTVRPSLADKVILRDKINLSENNQIIKSEFKKVNTLINFFSNIFSQFKNADTFYLTEIEATGIEKEIKKLNTKKASQNVGIIIKIIN